MSDERDMARIMSALYVVECAFDHINIMLREPLKELTGIYWRQALDTVKGRQGPITPINVNEMVSDSVGALYYIPQSLREELCEVERRVEEGSKVQESHDKWLRNNGVAMARLIADPITISMEHPWWRNDKGTSARIIEEVREAFKNIARAALNRKRKSLTLLVTEPVTMVAPVAGHASMAAIHITCRFGTVAAKVNNAT